MNEIKLDYCVDAAFTETEKDKLVAAVNILGKVVNDELFRDKVTNYTWSDTEKKYLTFLMNNDLSNQQVLEKLLNGRDKFENTDDYTLNLKLVPYENIDAIEGYVRGNSPEIHINKLYLDGWHPVVVAGIILHEYCHNLGFMHDQGFFHSLVKEHLHTVPYALGFILYDIANEVCKDDPSYLPYYDDQNKPVFMSAMADHCKDIVASLKGFK